MGRKPLPEEQRLSEMLHVRFTRAELDGLYRYAMRRRMSVAEVLRSYVRRVIAMETMAEKM